MYAQTIRVMWTEAGNREEDGANETGRQAERDRQTHRHTHLETETHVRVRVRNTDVERTRTRARARAEEKERDTEREHTHTGKAAEWERQLRRQSSWNCGLPRALPFQPPSRLQTHFLPW